MKHLYLTTFSALALLATPVFAATSSASFVKTASVANMFEIESSRVALEKSQDQNIKNFAQEMINDHSKTGDNLKATLQSANIDAQPSTTLDTAHQKKLNDLKNATGADFDRKYVQMQEDAHKEAVTLFQGYAQNGDNVDLKQFASDTLPTLEQHKSQIDSLAK